MFSKSLTLTVPFLLLVIFAKTLSVGTEVLSSASGTAQVESVRLNWTLGEMSILHWNSPYGGSITEGFHQPNIQVTPQISSINSQIRIAPNPTQSKLQLIVDKKEDKDLTAMLYSVDGKILMQLVQVGVGNTELDINHLPAGVYFLSLQYVNQAPSTTFKVVKGN